MGDTPTKQYILPEGEGGVAEVRVDNVTITRGVSEPVELTEEQAERANEALKITNGGGGLEEVRSKADAVSKVVQGLTNEAQVDARLAAEGISVPDDVKDVAGKRKVLEEGLREKASG